MRSPNFEYAQVGKALAATGDNAEAIIYFKRAAAAKSGPPDTVAALRNEAQVRYDLGERGLGHQEMMAAVTAFEKHFPDVTQSGTDNNEMQSYLADSAFQAAITGCLTAETDIQSAKSVLKHSSSSSIWTKPSRTLIR